MKQGNPQQARFGMHRESGKTTQNPPLEHIRQSLHDIFTTPIGSRIARRHYGSYLFALMDYPMTPANQLRVVAALVDAANRWEPRVDIQSAVLSIERDGKMHLNYHARTKDEVEIDGRLGLT